jgi:hypothetical protein
VFIYLGTHKIKKKGGDSAAQVFRMLAQMFNHTGGLLIVAHDNNKMGEGRIISGLQSALTVGTGSLPVFFEVAAREVVGGVEAHFVSQFGTLIGPSTQALK